MPSIRKNAIWSLVHLLGYSLGRATPNEIDNLARLAGGRRGHPAMKNLLPFCRTFSIEYEGITNDAAVNGEAWLLEATGPLDFKTLFDVGANVGKWTELAYRSHPHAHIHSFEIVGQTFAHLKANTQALADRVTINNCGLSDRIGEIDIYVDPQSDLISSAYDFELDAAKSLPTQTCRTRTGDDYAAEIGVDTIDFLKIDVEGAEGQVLQGFSSMLGRRAIRLAQFEYNRSAIVSRFLLRDFYLLFRKYGYRLGKLYPNGAVFRDYRLDDEDFAGPNYIACREEDVELQNRVAISAA